MPRSRSLQAAAVLLGLLVVASGASAQTRWVVDSKASLAWWQINPHLHHLWATTCPGEPSWRPGEGRSSGWAINPALELAESGYGLVDDTVHVPKYPRHRIHAGVCAEAVRGDVVATDTVHWRGVHGKVAVVAEALIMGESMRDVSMHRVLQTGQHPEITFALDSFVGMTRRGDTLSGRAVGTLTIRGVAKPTTAAVRAFPDQGGMRVLAKWRIPATDLLELAPGLEYIGLGVNTRLWKDFFMGTDLVLRPAAAAGD